MKTNILELIIGYLRVILDEQYCSRVHSLLVESEFR